MGWSREQPSTVTVVTVEPLDPLAVRFYKDPALSEELLPGDSLEFRFFQADAPLDRILEEGAHKELWLQNVSSIPLDLLEGGFEIGQGLQGGYGVELIECCNPILPGESRRFVIGIGGLAPEDFGKPFSLVIGALGQVDVAPLVSYTDLAVFNEFVFAETGLPTKIITFQGFPQNASSCGTTPLLANPLLLDGVAFVDFGGGCLETAFDGTTNRLLLDPATARIVLQGHSGIMLEIDGIANEPFEMEAVDTLGDTLGRPVLPAATGPAYLGFSSGAGIQEIRGIATFSGAPLPISRFLVAQ